jgi:hypothetical protein
MACPIPVRWALAHEPRWTHSREGLNRINAVLTELAGDPDRQAFVGELDVSDILRGIPGHIRSDNVLRRDMWRSEGQQVSILTEVSVFRPS